MSKTFRGFTLIELMVALAIITVITGVALSSQSSFNRTLVLANTAYDVALSLRSAQTYGIGSRAAGSLANAGYGLDFTRGAPQSFTLFADTAPAPSTSSLCHPARDPAAPDAVPGDCAYGAGDARVTTYTLGNRILVSDFCASASGRWSCANSGDRALSSLDIVFARPNPDPFMSANGAYAPSAPVSAACIALSAPGGGVRFVSVAASGAINANAASCP